MHWPNGMNSESRKSPALGGAYKTCPMKSKGIRFG